MKAELRIRTGCQLCLVGSDALQVVLQFAGIAVMTRREALRQRQVQALVAHVRPSRKVRIERPMGGGNRGASSSKRSQERASISAPHSIRSSLPRRFVAHGTAPATRLRSAPARAWPARHLESRHQLLHLLEVPQFLARQPRQRNAQRAILRIRKHQRQRSGGGLLLAVGMVHQQFAPALHGRIDPGRRRWRLQYRCAASA